MQTYFNLSHPLKLNTKRCGLAIRCQEVYDEEDDSPLTGKQFCYTALQLRNEDTSSSYCMKSPMKIESTFPQCSLGSRSKGMYNETVIPEDTSVKESNIHSFLDNMNINQINVSEYIQSKNKAKMSSKTLNRVLKERAIEPNLEQRRSIFLHLNNK